MREEKVIANLQGPFSRLDHQLDHRTRRPVVTSYKVAFRHFTIKKVVFLILGGGGRKREFSINCAR